MYRILPNKGPLRAPTRAVRRFDKPARHNKPARRKKGVRLNELA